MFSESVVPALMQRSTGEMLVTRNLHFAGIGESSLEEILEDLLREQSNPTLALYASGGTVRVQIASRQAREAGRTDGPVERDSAAYEGELYGVDGQALNRW